MVKLASARESRMYAPGLSRTRGEYTNAGLYVFATVMLISGFAAEFSMEPKSGLVLLLIGFVTIIVVNVHDLIAHLAGFDYRFPLMEFDNQLALVEFAVPVVQVLGSLLWFLAVLFLFIQEEKGYGYYFALENHALNMIIAGTVLWVVGSIHNSCQIYERGDGHVQILQQSVHIPFLMGSLVFLVGSILNSHEQSGLDQHGIQLLGTTLLWMGIFGSFLFFTGGLANVVKVFKMQQNNGVRLEKLRGGAQDRLVEAREGNMPLIQEEQRRRVRLVAEETIETPLPTPYKDVLVGQAGFV